MMITGVGVWHLIQIDLYLPHFMLHWQGMPGSVPNLAA
jgi:hypothetical protein